MDRSKYPDDWDEISKRIRFERAGGCCEGSPSYPDCRAEHGKAHPVTGSLVILTTAHFDHDTENRADENLRAWCQRCHLTHDAGQHAASAAETRFRQRVRNTIPLFGGMDGTNRPSG